MDLEQALTRIGDLERQVTSLTGERDVARTALTELEAAKATVEGQVTELTETREAAQRALSETNALLDAARLQGVGHLRRALLAEHAGQVIPELVSGTTEDELVASVEVARAAHARAVEAARVSLTSMQVPAGAGSARSAGASDGLTPLQMIESGLRK